MQTIKTALVVVLLLAVCYGAIVALNAPDPALPAELKELARQGELDLSMDPSELASIGIQQPRSGGATTVDSDAGFGSTAASTFAPPALPKFGLDGIPQNFNGPDSRMSQSMATVPIPETQGPDGPVVALPNASGFGDVPSLIAQPTLGSMSDSLSNLPSTQDSNFPSTTNLPGHLTSSTSSGSSTPGNSTYAGAATSQLNSPMDQFATPPSLANNNSPTVSELDAANPLAQQSGGGNVKSAGSASETKLPTQSFEHAREQALKLAKEGKLKDALFTLSMFYDSVELTHAEYVDMIDIVDALAAEVVYSKQHLIEPPYRAVAGDTVQSIAIKHSITPELLARINGLGDSNVVLPGSEFKVVRGPFRVNVDLTRGELTLFVGDLYAGRFPISVGEDPIPREGTFEVVDKRRDRTYYGAKSNIISADDPRNPYGGFWLNLGQDLSIHGTAEMATSDLSKAGCISLAPIDASDVYGILAQGSKVRIHR